MIEFSEVSKTYAASNGPSVTNLSLTIGDGVFQILAGPSGCGKTTTLNMLNRLIERDAGTIRIDGRDIRDEDPVALRRRIGYAFQEAGLFPHMTVSENIAITPRLLGWNTLEQRARVDELLTLIRLPDIARRFPRELSGGQRQRVALARALAARPKILLLDEPFGALDPLTRDELADDYRRIHDELHLTTVMVTHDMTEALLLGDRIAVMRDGTIAQIGTPQELMANPADDFVARMIATPQRRAKRLAAAMGENAP
ncbi:MAG TPA: ATP-binding cassette domain-containing protein [Rudaea sp.]|nr:ATP-binding cassette domain-containing protein [Rudaea sp.]